MKKLTARTKWIIWGVIIAIVILAVALYWHHLIIYPNTDDSYVQANVVNVAPQVSGPVSSVYVKNNEIVKKGQPLFDIDPRPFQIAVNQASAKLSQAVQQMQSDVQAVATAKATLAERQSQLMTTHKNSKRTFYLVNEGQMSKEDGDNAINDDNVAEANLNAAKSQLAQAKAQLGEMGDRNANIRAAKATLAQAQLNLSYTHITAPADGKLINFLLRPGTMLQAGQPQFNMVEQNVWWVNANYKETQMKRIRDGQPAVLSMEMYPGVEFKGHVESVSAGSGAAFSMLPPENATGNWVKVTQRFPVRIALDKPPAQYPLRMGASGTVTIDTSH